MIIRRNKKGGEITMINLTMLNMAKDKWFCCASFIIDEIKYVNNFRCCCLVISPPIH